MRRSQSGFRKSLIAWSGLTVLFVALLAGVIALVEYRVFDNRAAVQPAHTLSVDIRPNFGLPAEMAGWDNVVKGLLSAFDHVDVVALGETHGSKMVHELLLRLIQAPSFPEKARYIIVEFGNSLYQPILDRYIAGGDVPLSEVRQVWQNTTVIQTWDSPLYAEFFAAVREVNRKLPAGRRLRLIAGDPPIDWNKVHSRYDVEPFLTRRAFPVSLNGIAVSRGEKVLVIYGSGHLKRPSFPHWTTSNEAPSDEGGSLLPPSAPKIFKALQASSSARVFTVTSLAGMDPIEAILRSPERPVLVSLIGTRAAKVENSASLNSKLGDQYDACVYFGNAADATAIVRPSRGSYRDISYSTEIARRLRIFETGR